MARHEPAAATSALRDPTPPRPDIGPFVVDRVTAGDCTELIPRLPDGSIDIVVTSPPYWGQRLGVGMGNQEDPRVYVRELAGLFTAMASKLKERGLLWINLGDAYNTPVNWRRADHRYSTLGADREGLPDGNSAYVKPRARRRPYLEPSTPWLRYGNLLALPHRLVIAVCDAGYLFRGEVIWRKSNPLPEGRCRRPHRQHESIYLFARSEQHAFRISPPVGSVWELVHEKLDGASHFSRFPRQLPQRCIEAYGKTGADVVVLDPFSGSGATGLAALELGCSFIGFEIDPAHAEAANQRLRDAEAPGASAL